MKNTEREYKFRAEFDSDADLVRACLAPWLKRWQVYETVLDNDGKPFWVPDVQVELTVSEQGPTKGEIKWLINTFEDCHVAAESFDGAAEYTGARHDLDASDCIVAPPGPDKLELALKGMDHYLKFLREHQPERVNEARSALHGQLLIARSVSPAVRKTRATRARRAAEKA